MSIWDKFLQQQEEQEQEISEILLDVSSEVLQNVSRCMQSLEQELEVLKGNIRSKSITSHDDDNSQKENCGDGNKIQTNKSEAAEVLQIKLERMSEELVRVKTEEECMPPPIKVPARKKAEPKPRKTRSKAIKTESDNEISSRRTRSTRTMKKILESDSDCDAEDVILQNEEVPPVQILDSDSDIDTHEFTPVEDKSPTTTRRTRTKSKKPIEEKKRLRSPSEENIAVSENNKGQLKKNLNKRQKSTEEVTQKEIYETVRREPEKNTNKQKKPIDNNVSQESEEQLFKDVESSMYEDALSSGDLEKRDANKNNILLNETYAAEKQKKNETAQNVNETMVLENPKVLLNETRVISSKIENTNGTIIISRNSQENTKTKDCVPENGDPLITDDESDDEVLKPQQKVPEKLNNNTKQIFSPYSSSPVKKRVEAFEKLEAKSKVDLPPRLTRTKTKALAKEKENNFESDLLALNTVKEKREKIKYATPLSANRFLPSSASSSKATSAYKHSLQEMREMQQRRKEKDQEAIRKKEALMQAQSEEMRRKREEKQLKAQQMREAKEKEKQRLLGQAEKQKLLKAQQYHLEKQERMQKQKEESDHKRLLAAKKAAMELQKKEEENQKSAAEYDIAESGKVVYKKKLQKPIYMVKTMPLLPTNDCYDSDDKDADQGQRVAVSWPNKRRYLIAMYYGGPEVVNTFFQIKAQTPDLADIFQNISARKLKRNSSAVWRKAPRYTLFPTRLDEDEEDYDA